MDSLRFSGAVRYKRRMAALATVTALGLVLSACGGGGGGGGVNSTPTPSAPANPTTPTNPTPPADPTPPVSATPALSASLQAQLEAGAKLGGNEAARAGSGRVTSILLSYKDNPITYDKVNGTYTLSLDSYVVNGVGSTSLSSVKLSGVVANGAPSAANEALSYVFTTADGSRVPVIFYNTGGDFKLSYTSFGLMLLPTAGMPEGVQHAVVFGTPTATLPTTGVATYEGIVSGVFNASDATSYGLTGTSHLTADFGAGTFQTSLDIAATGDITGPANGPAQGFTGSYVGIGGVGTDGSTTIAIGKFVTNLNGSFVKNGTSNGIVNGGFNGKFFGPNAEEFGYAFTIQDGTNIATGVAVGKKK